MTNEITLPANAPADFVQTIKRVYEKAKANGDSLIGFGDFVNSYWNAYKSGQGTWELKDVNGDGVMEWVNMQTQEIKPVTGMGANSLTGLESDIDSQLNSTATPQVQGTTIAVPDLGQNGNATLDSIGQNVAQNNQPISETNLPDSIKQGLDEINNQPIRKPVLGGLFGTSTGNGKTTDPTTGKETSNINLSGDSSQTQPGLEGLPAIPESYQKRGFYMGTPASNIWQDKSLYWGTQNVPVYANQQPLGLVVPQLQNNLSSALK